MRSLKSSDPANGQRCASPSAATPTASTMAVIEGRFMVGISAENREKAGVAGSVDTEPSDVTSRPTSRQDSRIGARAGP
jgi:hypothetical protein